MILTSEEHAKHTFAGQNTQQTQKKILAEGFPKKITSFKWFLILKKLRNTDLDKRMHSSC